MLSDFYETRRHIRVVMSLVKQHFIVTQTIRKIEISALLGSWVTNTPAVKMLCPQENCFFLYCRKNMTCLCIGLLGICQFFSFSRKTVFRLVTTNCSFVSDVTVPYTESFQTCPRISAQLARRCNKH